MVICRDCGVQLEDDMEVCPLCEAPVTHGGMHVSVAPSIHQKTKPESGKNLLQQILWQVTAVLMLSCIVATLIINLSIQGAITWSVYPISICLIVLSYASLVALWRTKLSFRILSGWLISAFVLFIISRAIDVAWPVTLALPLLSAVNVTGLTLILVFTRFKAKGLNGLAAIFVLIAILCLLIEGIISIYLTGFVALKWSIIVAACLLPVITAILFMYFRTRNNRELQKIFHT